MGTRVGNWKQICWKKKTNDDGAPLTVASVAVDAESDSDDGDDQDGWRRAFEKKVFTWWSDEDDSDSSSSTNFKIDSAESGKLNLFEQSLGTTDATTGLNRLLLFAVSLGSAFAGAV